MKFIIHVSGHPFGLAPGTHAVYSGPHTHMRSEGTWVLGVALNMARHGHEVKIVEYEWGDQNKYPLPPNISLQKGFGGDCDVYIDVGWDDVYAVQRSESIKAKLYIHGWGGTPHSSHLLKYVSPRGLKNHFMARTSRACYRDFQSFPFSIYMPAPLIDKIRTNGNFSSKKMLWANRGAWNKEYSIESERILSFMEAVQDSYHYKVLLYGDIVGKAAELGQRDIARRFESLQDKELLEPYYGIPHDQFMQELGESKILLTNGHPSVHPQTLEAVCMGCIPLLRKVTEHHFQDIQPDGSIKINEVFGCDGTEGIAKIISDEGLYQEYFSNLARVTKDHEYANSYNILMNEIGDRI